MFSNVPSILYIYIYIIFKLSSFFHEISFGHVEILLHSHIYIINFSPQFIPVSKKTLTDVFLKFSLEYELIKSFSIIEKFLKLRIFFLIK